MYVIHETLFFLRKNIYIVFVLPNHEVIGIGNIWNI